MKRFLQDLLAPVTISLVAGVSLVSLPLYLGYSTTFGLVFVLPVIFFVLLPAIPSASAKLQSLCMQLRWWHFLWLLVFLSGLVFRIRDVETIQANALDFWAIYRIILMGIVAFVLLCRLALWGTDWDRSLFQGLIGFLAVYALVSIVSTLWSIYPMWTLYKSTEYLIDVALIAAIVVSVRTVEEFKTLFDWTWVLYSFLIASVWLGVAVWPEQAIIREGLIGFQIFGILPAIETNGVGDLGALLGIVALTRLLFPNAHRLFYLGVFFFSIATLVLSQSRSPLTGFLFALILILFTARRIGIVAYFAMLVPTVLFLTNLGDLFWEFFQRGQTPEVFESVSGRVLGWELGWDLFEKQPLTGYGAYAAARFGVLTQIGGIFLYGSSILNTWLEILLGTGLLGFIPLLGAFLGAWMILLRFVTRAGTGALAQHLQVEAIGVLTFLSVRSMFTVELIWHPPLTFLVVLGYAELLRRAYSEQGYEATSNLPTISYRAVNVRS